LVESLGNRYGIRDAEIQQFADFPADVGETRVRAIKYQRQRTRLTLALSILLARKATTSSNLKKASENLAVALFRLQVPAQTTNAVRAALIETALQLSDDRNRAGWISESRLRLDALSAQGVTADWFNAIGMPESEALGHLGAIRKALGFPPFRRPTPQYALNTDDLKVSDEALQIPISLRPNPTRIKNVNIRSFRGIVGELKLDFTDTMGKAASCLIYGDNGVGKSTIVSAIEFACQARIGRQAPIDSPMHPQAVNIEAINSEARVEVTFNDESKLVRSIKRGKGAKVEGAAPRSADFSLAPMSVQRRDITRFLGTGPAERGRLFIDHFAINSDFELDPSEIQETLAVRYGDLRNQLQELGAQVVGTSGGPTPANEQGFVRAISQKYFEGLSRREWEARTGRKAPREAVELLDKFRRIDIDVKTTRKQLREIKKARKIPLYELQVRRLGVLLGDVDEPITEAVRRVIGDDWVKGIHIVVGRVSAISIELEVELANGKTVTPENFFSEGIQDLIALLFLFEVVHAAADRGQARVLILDDALQSVDSTVRLNLIDYILERCKGWQLFITTHDRLWREQLVQLLKKHNYVLTEREIRSWLLDAGPEVRGTRYDPGYSMREALSNGNAPSICGEAGRLLEQILDVLSWTLPVSVTRRYEDRYTIGDLWPPTLKKLKKTGACEAAEEVNKWFHLRNLIGAHYNSWASSLSISDAENFGRAILSLLQFVYCASCGQWVKANGHATRWDCRCGAVTIRNVAGGIEA